MKLRKLFSWNSRWFGNGFWAVAGWFLGSSGWAIYALRERHLEQALGGVAAEVFLAIACVALIVGVAAPHIDDSDQGRRIGRLAGLGAAGTLGSLALANFTVWYLATLLPK